VTLDNLRIINNSGGSGVLAVDGSTTVRNSFISGNYQGMWVGSDGNGSTAGSLTVENTVSRNNTFHGLLAKVSGTISLNNYSGLYNPISGFNSYGGSHVVINGGHFRNNGRNGIRLDGVRGAEISDIQVAGNGSINNPDSTGGGGIQIVPASSDPIIIQNSTVIDNESQGNGGGLEVWSTYSAYHPAVTVLDTLISWNQTSRNEGTIRRGGGISVVGWADVRVEQSTIRNNLSYMGGGIHADLYYDTARGVDSKLTIVDSTLSGNESVLVAGGVSVVGGDFQLLGSTVSNNITNNGAGGVSVASRTGVMLNSTISGNSTSNTLLNGGMHAGGIVSQPGESFHIVNSTIANNSGLNVGGLFSSNSTTLANSLIAGNSHLSGQLWEDGGIDTVGSVTSRGGNLVGKLLRTSGFSASADLLGTELIPIDALIGPLQNNGGPTETHQLFPGSPAINTGLGSIPGLTIPDVDQRGAPRSFAGAVDIGSFEVNSVDVGPVPDLQVNSVVLDGNSGLTVTYTISGNNSPEFDFSFLKSSDGVVDASDHLLETITITDATLRTPGVHSIQLQIGSGAGQVSLPGTDSLDDESEYGLFVVANRDSTVLESDLLPLEDNVAEINGAYRAGTTVFVYGDQSNESYVAKKIATTLYQLARNGVPMFSWPQNEVGAFRFRGRGGDDVLSINGLALPALLIGGTGNDSLTGGSSSDVLIGGAGNDVLIGGTGNDAYRFDVDEVLGSDTVTDAGGADLLDFGQTTAQGITVNIGLTTIQTVTADRLFLTLMSASSIDHVTGGQANDLILGNTLANILTGGDGDDILQGLGGNDTIVGGGGSDAVDGGAGNDTYLFDADSDVGSDSLTDASGTDTISFENSSANVVFSLGVSTAQPVNGGLLSITLTSASIIENIKGGAGDDSLTGNTLANILVGGPGNDLLAGASGNDTYLFLADSPLGSDTLIDTVGTETVSFGGTTSDITFSLNLTTTQTVNSHLAVTLSALTFDNAVGGSGNDYLAGNNGTNVLTGGGGNDTLAGAGGNDTYSFDADLVLGVDTIIESGSGTDTIDLSATSTSSVAVDLSTTSLQVVNSRLSLILQSAAAIESVRGGSRDDLLIGNSLANILTGNAGNDTLLGLDGDDLLIGGAGNDVKDGGDGDDQYQFDTDVQIGSDTVIDSTGIDALDFALSTTMSIVVDMEIVSTQVINTNLTLTIPYQLEIVLGTALNDTIRGNSLANILIGNAGNDILDGRGGNDILVGGLGIDVIYGGADQDILIAGRTSYDGQLVSVRRLLSEWTSASSYATRVSNLRLGVGSPVLRLKAKSTVLNDSLAGDQLAGNSEEDWFFAALDDIITDFSAGELIDSL
jgi:Ca2+-binding RTX toxin-like protein